jgi:hypothetical protein
MVCVVTGRRGRRRKKATVRSCVWLGLQSIRLRDWTRDAAILGRPLMELATRSEYLVR